LLLLKDVLRALENNSIQELNMDEAAKLW